jgi:hypothetical protein
MERHPYKEVVFKDFPILYVDSFTDLTQKLLEDNEHLYSQALELDMTKLDLDKIYNDRII